MLSVILVAMWDLLIIVTMMLDDLVRAVLMGELRSVDLGCGRIPPHQGNIANVSMVSRAPDFYEMHIELEVADAKHLARIMSELKKKSVVSRVARITG